MSTGGVSHLLQVLFGLFCSWSKWLKPPAFCAKSCKGLVEARGAFRVCLVQNPAFCGFQVARRESGGVEPPTWAHLSAWRLCLIKFLAQMNPAADAVLAMASLEVDLQAEYGRVHHG